MINYKEDSQARADLASIAQQIEELGEGGAGIDDAATSSESTWSSQKIQTELSEAGLGVGIDDTEPLSDMVLSSKKTAQLTNYARTKLTFMGDLFTAEDAYNSWVTKNSWYDATTDKIVILYNAGTGHTSGGGPLKIRTIDRTTGAVSASSIVAEVADRKMVTCAAMQIANGDYLAIVAQIFTDAAGHIDKFVICRSVDHGANWTMADMVVPAGNYQNAAYGLYQLANGRLIASTCIVSDSKTYIFYSDDNGANWSRTTILAPAGVGTMIGECQFFQFPNGKIICLARKGLSNYNVTEPALVSYSIDNGATWSQFVESTSITDCSSIAPPAIVDHPELGMIELIWGSRRNFTEGRCRIYQTIATYEDAEADNFPAPVIIGRALAHTADEVLFEASDFGYFGGCRDTYGGVHVFYYDLDAGGTADTNIKYLKGTRNTKPLKQDVEDLYEKIEDTDNVVTITGNTTISKAHHLKVLNCTAATVFTVPEETDAITFPEGTEIGFFGDTSGEVSFAEGSVNVSVLQVDGYLKLKGQYATAALKRIAANKWALCGMLKA